MILSRETPVSLEKHIVFVWFPAVLCGRAAHSAQLFSSTGELVWVFGELFFEFFVPSHKKSLALFSFNC